MRNGDDRAALRRFGSVALVVIGVFVAAFGGGAAALSQSWDAVHADRVGFIAAFDRHGSTCTGEVVSRETWEYFTGGATKRRKRTAYALVIEVADDCAVTPSEPIWFRVSEPLYRATTEGDLVDLCVVDSTDDVRFELKALVDAWREHDAPDPMMARVGIRMVFAGIAAIVVGFWMRPRGA